MRGVIYVNVANVAYVFRGRNLATVLIFSALELLLIQH